ncbi:MAG: ISLre2 family transposase [Tepidanaerobacteraceae bacterium]|jgi:hypothetical protein|nr:ISLre2 family transposase [Tepidanaerobacteraceae bacterium]
MDIIQRVHEKFLLAGEKIIETLDGKYTYPVFVEQLKEILNELGREVCTEVIEEMDKKIYSDKQERKDWRVVQKDCKRTIIGEFGDITYKRRYYENKVTGEKAYLVDKIMGIDKYERVDLDLRGDILDLSTMLSYEKSTQELKREGANCNISRQTVMNTIRKTDNLQTYEKPQEKKKVEVLYIEADEDHIHLQGNKKSGEVKLVYIHEGLNNITKGRNGLINVKYFAGVRDGKEIEKLWLQVWSYIKDVYDEDSIKHIFVSGDGARWIKDSKEYLPNVVYVLDLFHLQKYITAALKDDKKTKRALLKALFKQDRDKANEILNQKLKELNPQNPENPITKCQKYINSNWDGICAYSLYKDQVIGCSAESHVSHILSERLSRGPISWSEPSADKLAQLRAMKANGISIKEAILKQRYEALKPIKLPKQTLYKERHKIKKLKQAASENITNLPVLSYKKTFTSMAIKSLLSQSVI